MHTHASLAVDRSASGSCRRPAGWAGRKDSLVVAVLAGGSPVYFGAARSYLPGHGDGDGALRTYAEFGKW